MMLCFKSILLALTLWTLASAFAPNPSHRPISSTTQLNALSSRRDFMKNGAGFAAAASATLLFPLQAAQAAKPVDPTLKGTKDDPEYQACVSQCMYDCTKPKGMEQKSRLECLPECKQKCATTKQQLMKGTPSPSAE
mmetsp:Transcript_31887/g.47395  ORF Transcript_31887/g.47395 Transcript_31887/m.47395 type:complete len:137 (-) Transcript_31887:191-601(-)